MAICALENECISYDSSFSSAVPYQSVVSKMSLICHDGIDLIRSLDDSDSTRRIRQTIFLGYFNSRYYRWPLYGPN